MERHIIWSNHDLNFEDWKADLQAGNPDMSEDELYDEMIRLNNEYLDDERMNLDIELDNDIVLIADVGRWNGRHLIICALQFRNIKDLLRTDCDYATWYVEDGELRCNAYHHDGVNHYWYRVLREGVDAADIDFYDDPEEGRRVILEKTESIAPVVCGVYGWEVSEK